jgi:CAAX prenyl protease-like protein
MKDLLTPAALARWAPFALFMLLLAVRGAIPPDGALDARWVYGVSTVAVGGLLIAWRGRFAELSGFAGCGQAPAAWVSALLAIVGGLVMFELWVTLTQPWMMLGEPTATFRPVNAQGELIWPLVVVRWIGASLVVPVMEELFWRSFLMRWIDNPDFEQVAPQDVSLKAMGMSSLVFMLAHTQWLGALLAGLLFAWVYRYTRSLWAAVLCHAVTNGVLGAWVVFNGVWQFW